MGKILCATIWGYSIWICISQCNWTSGDNLYAARHSCHRKLTVPLNRLLVPLKRHNSHYNSLLSVWIKIMKSFCYANTIAFHSSFYFSCFAETGEISFQAIIFKCNVFFFFFLNKKKKNAWNPSCKVWIVPPTNKHSIIFLFEILPRFPRTSSPSFMI